MGFADLHIHSIHSYDGTSSIPAILKHVAEKTNLNVIAITDHNTTSGNQEALELGPLFGVDVVPGCEVSTAQGHLLALFVRETPTARLSLVETALCIAEMGGLCIPAHPTARGTSSLTFEVIRNALEVPGVAEVMVGIEAINGGLVLTRQNAEVEAECKTMPLAQCGNSDAHVLTTIGQGRTEFKGRSAEDLRKALIAHTTTALQGKGLDGVGVLQSYLPRYLLRKLGWTQWTSNPGQPMKMVRMSEAMAGLRSNTPVKL